MKKRLFFLVVLWCTGCVAVGQTVDVVLIGGQSNATGQGIVANLPRQFVADTSVWIFHSPYLKSGKAPFRWLPLCGASESPDRFGAELSLGTELERLQPERRWVLIKHALSGSNLFAQWNPGNRSGETQGDEYRKFIETVRMGLDSLKQRGLKPVIRAMVWQQGEADARFDAGVSNTMSYAANLKNLIESVRSELQTPEMAFVLGEVLPVPQEKFTGRNAVRSAQRQVAQEVSGAYIVACDDLQRRSSDYHSPYPTDDVHIGTFGMLILGERYAAAVVGAQK